MSTIVYKNGLMAADSRAWAGDRMPVGAKRKIHRLKDGSLVGISSSSVGAPEQFKRALDEQEVCEQMENCACPDDIQALLVKPNGDVYYWNEGPGFTGPVVAEFYAIGTGAHAALGAMFMGADVELAIEVACKVDYCSALPVLIEKLEAKKEKRRVAAK